MSETRMRETGAQLENWARITKNPAEDILTWYAGGIPLPDADTRPADVVYAQFRHVDEVASVRGRLIEGVATALGMFASGKEKWETSIVLNLLVSSRDLGPDPRLGKALRDLFESWDDSNILHSEHVLQDALRSAMAVNQFDLSLKGLWLGLLSGHQQGCLPPAPAIDIVGACRIGDVDEPPLIDIATAIRLYSDGLIEVQTRRRLMHAVWDELSLTWSKEKLDDSWNWELIQAGIAAKWSRWVFETVPKLWGKIPGDSRDRHFLWRLCAEKLGSLFDDRECIPNVPVCLVPRPNLSDDQKVTLAGIDRKRRGYSYYSSKGLEGIITDETSYVSEPQPQPCDRAGETPTFTDRWTAARRDFEAA